MKRRPDQTPDRPAPGCGITEQGCGRVHAAQIYRVVSQGEVGHRRGGTDVSRMRQGHVLNGREDSGRQRYLCKRRFGDNLGFEYRHTSPPFITPALVLNGAGTSPFGMQIMLGHLNVRVHADTISGWLEHHVGLAEEYTGSIQPPNLGSRLGADGKRQDGRGELLCQWQWILPPASCWRGGPLQTR